MEEDRLYLKKFVQQHPENKMGWYLLGKEYVAQGKEAKAAYCFAQAGEVYEAYEAKKINVTLPEHLYMEGAPNGERPEAAAGKLTMRTRLVLLLLAMVMLAMIATAPGGWRKQPSEPPELVLSAANDAAVFYTHGFSKPDERKNALQTIFFPQGASWKYAVLAKGTLTSDGQWVLWPRKPVIELTSERSDVTGQPDVAYFDAEKCNCKPGDSTKAQQTTDAWMAVEEQIAVVRSALISYTKQYGEAPPDTIDKLVSDYPKNVLPGYTETMKQAYPAIAAQLVQKKAAAADPASAAGTAQTQTAAVSHYGNTPLEEPLEIIVDKQNHRLALVSGKVMIRNYAVGLGGVKTPERSFVISEKVRNPNGRSNGEFGSRGMTLSDTLFAIHGTNDPTSIGKDESLGCVRMRKEDVEELFDMVPIGTKVTIGQGGLPGEEVAGESRFKVEPLREETNPGKVYRWLN